MKRFPFSKLTFLLATLLSLVLMTAQVASAAPIKEETWKIVKSPNGSFHNNLLNNVVAFSKDDAWAVGANYTGPEGPPVQGLIEHWNGLKWSIVSTPNVGTHDNVLIGVSAVSASDIWSVGFANDSNNIMRTLIEHWNGKSWKVVPSPNVGSQNTVLNNIITEVVAISASNIWTSGDYVLASGQIQTLLEHWNGSQWSVVQTPNIGSHDDYFQGIAADSANDIWAVGADNDPVNHQQLTLIEHCC